MNDETTRLINEQPSRNEQSSAETQCQSSSQTETADGNKTPKKGNTVAAAAGGFVAGVGVGVGATAAASNRNDEPVADETVSAEVKEEAPVETQETIEAPTPEQAILANDEGIRYAHVDADNFNDAFAQARAQVGAGGVFEYNGKLYGTYLADEWNEMTPQERADYQSRVNEVAPSHHAEPSHSAPTHSEPIPEPEVTIEAETIPTNAEMISPEPVDNEIRVLGVETVQDSDGQIMNVALVENQGDHALLVDVDNDGTIEVLIHDDNGDGQLQEGEIHDMSDAGISIAELQQAQAAAEGDLLYAANDNMPDYVNDADSTMFA